MVALPQRGFLIVSCAPKITGWNWLAHCVWDPLTLSWTPDFPDPPLYIQAVHKMYRAFELQHVFHGLAKFIYPCLSIECVNKMPRWDWIRDWLRLSYRSPVIGPVHTGYVEGAFLLALTISHGPTVYSGVPRGWGQAWQVPRPHLSIIKFTYIWSTDIWRIWGTFVNRLVNLVF